MKSIKYNNTIISYSDQGSGNAVVLLHGFLENSTMWNDYAKILSRTKRVICIDFPGHGKSGNLDEIHSMEAVAYAVDFVLTKINCKRYALVGHSMGGYVAMAMAELFPQNITQLMLFFSSAAADSDEKKINRDRAKKVVAQNKDMFLRVTLSGLFSPQTIELYPNELEGLVKEAKSMSEESIISALEGMKIRTDRRSLLNKLPFPVTMVSGENDPVIPLDAVLEQHQANAVKKVTITPNGHLGYIEDRDVSLSLIQEFLAE